MATEKELLLEDFGKKSFPDQKDLLLDILSKLYGTNPVVRDLWDMVHNLQDTTRSDILSEVYELILDAVYATKEDETQESIANLEKAKDVLVEMRRQEEAERRIEIDNLDIDGMLA